MALTRLRDKKRKEGRAQVVIHNEPTFGGKRLREWLVLNPSGELPEPAREAVKRIGTNAVPVLWEMLVYRDPEFGLVDYPINWAGAVGFVVLGEQAKSVLPKLVTLIDQESESIALLGLVAALDMGAGSVQIWTQALTNRNSTVRTQASVYLAEPHTRAFPEARRQAVPALLKLLDDADESVRRSAMDALKEIDPLAAALAAIR